MTSFYTKQRMQMSLLMLSSRSSQRWLLTFLPERHKNKQRLDLSGQTSTNLNIGMFHLCPQEARGPKAGNLERTAHS